MIQNFEDFCRELNNCGFSMGGGNAKGIFALIDYDWLNQDALDTPVKWHCGDPEVDPWEWRMRVLEKRTDISYSKVFFDKTTDLVRQLSFGTYNQKFKPNRTTADWLCADETELDKYLADPLVRKDISAGLFWELLGSMKRTGSAYEYDGWDTSIPILLISGQDDPVGDGGKGVQEISRRMKKSGMENVTIKLFPGARHDLLHEEKNGADASRKFIAEWIQP